MKPRLLAQLRADEPNEGVNRPTIEVRDVVLEEMKKRRRGDHLANCVLSRLGWYRSQGFQESWEQHPFGYRPHLDVQWRPSLGSYSTWASKRRIEAYERELLDGGYLEFPPVNPFADDASAAEDNSADLRGIKRLQGRSTLVRPLAEPHLDAPFGTSKTLDGGRDWNVTLSQRTLRTSPEELIRDLTPIHRKLARKLRRTYSLEESLENDLIQEGRMRVFEKLHLYEGRARFTTWAWTVSWRAMLDHAEWLVRGRKNEVFGLDETHVASDFAATSDLRLTLFSAMRAVPNSDLVLYSAFGYQDKEIAAGNIRMRRSRARDRLQVLLREDLALSA